MDTLTEFLKEVSMEVAIALMLGLVALFRRRIFDFYVLLKEWYYSWPKHFKGVSGSIEFPEPSSIIIRTIVAKGSCSGMKKDASLWIFVEIEGSVWPKSQVNQLNENKWSVDFAEDGIPVGRSFKILLVYANSFGTKLVNKYLTDCSQSGHYPGKRSFLGTEILDKVIVKF